MNKEENITINDLNMNIGSYFFYLYMKNNLSKKYPEIIIKPDYFKIYKITGNIIYTSNGFYFIDKFTKDFSKIRLVPKVKYI